MISQLIYNGKNLREFGITIEHLPESVHPQRRGDAYRIAGRNGTRRREDGTFENYDQPYDVWFKDFAANRDVYQLSRDLAGFLLGSSDFCRLEDTYEPDVFRLACYAGPMNVAAVLRRYGRATLVFDCLPERYLKSGEKAITVMENVASTDVVSFDLENPTGMLARPLVRVTGSGAIHFRMDAEGYEGLHVGIQLSTRSTVILDSEKCTVKFEDGTEANSITRLNDDNEYPVWPVLWPKTTTIRHGSYSAAGTLEKLEIIPRWWSP